MMKLKLFFLLILIPLFVFGQTTEKNWAKSIMYKVNTSTGISQPTAQEATVSVTYFDGFGRPIQENAHQQAGVGSRDLVSYTTYDDFGRVSKKSLPFPAAGNMAYVNNPESAAENFAPYQGQNPYVEYSYGDPAIFAQKWIAAPGVPWRKSDGKQVLVENNIDKTVTKVTDENGNITQEYRDYRGLVYAKVSYLNNEEVRTTYEYDDYDNLKKVCSPKFDSSEGNPNSENNLCYRYEYDDKNRLIAKKIPGKQWEYIVYDALNRIVATGPVYHPFGTSTGEMGWLYNRYDEQNRVVLTGWIPEQFYTGEQENTDNNDYDSFRQAMQVQYDGTVVNSRKYNDGSYKTINGFNVHYSDDGIPSNLLLLTVNYYDNYNFNLPTAIDFSTPYNNVYYDNNLKKPRGLPTVSWVRSLVDRNGPITGEFSYVLYDYRGTPVVSHLYNFKGGYTRSFTKLDFVGSVLATSEHHYFNNNAPRITVNQRFEYTPQGRLAKQEQQVIDPVNSNVTWHTLAENEYDVLGRLVGKTTGKVGGDYMQHVDYQYNIRGWLTGINDTSNLAARPGAPDDLLHPDLFSFKINYDQVDGVIPGATGYFNGNISETYWRTATDNTIRKYSYQYDPLNRMTDAVYQKPESNNPIRDSYNEHVMYDKNGNITHLTRNGNLDVIGTTLQIDNLVYVYENNQSNKLVKLLDGTNNPSGARDVDLPLISDYYYDKNGNVTKDSNKNMHGLQYNHLNLPVFIGFGGSNNITYTYSATGQKLEKAVNPGGGGAKYTNYMGRYQYFQNDLKFIFTSEGYVSATRVAEDGYKYNYVYQYKDHLGNVRLSYARDSQAPYNVKILEENHYYPFGLKHGNYNPMLEAFIEDLNQEGRVVLTGDGLTEDSVNKYKFNGCEYQDELGLNLYDMDMRDYDPGIGRWLGIDPVTHFSQSPFCGMDNNPVFWADPSGADGEPINTWHYSGSNSMYSGAGNMSSGDHMFGSSGDSFWMDNIATTGDGVVGPISMYGNTVSIYWNSVSNGSTATFDNGVRTGMSIQNIQKRGVLNWFNQDKDGTLWEVANADNTNLDRVLIIYAHGNTNVMLDENGNQIKSLSELNAILIKESTQWKDFVTNGGKFTLVLKSCYTGALGAKTVGVTTNRNIARDFSFDKPGLTVIAPSGAYTTFGAFGFNTSFIRGSDGVNSWNVYYGGSLIKRFKD